MLFAVARREIPPVTVLRLELLFAATEKNEGGGIVRQKAKKEADDVSQSYSKYGRLYVRLVDYKYLTSQSRACNRYKSSYQ